MIKVSVVGTGNVGHHLAHVISNAKGVSLLQIIDSRTDSFARVQPSAKHKQGGQKIEEPDLYILAVNDDAIKFVSRKLVKTESLVVHTSGSVPMEALPKENRRGVFYPLQTFSKNSKVDFTKVPICIEAENKTDLKLLHELANALSQEVHEVSSEKRTRLHLAAVFVNNFTNHLYKIGSDLCVENGLPFSMLKPLIDETAHKLARLSPEKAQTGPAKRGDEGTIKEHLKLLTSKENKEIYALISQSIQRTYGEKL